ncbi:MAG: hypothetical protein RL071_213 [Pseudomonadota bacterium]
MRAAALLLLGLLPSAAASPLSPFPGCGEPGRPDLCPNDLGSTWNLLSWFPAEWASVRAEEVALGPGLWADRAWALSVGLPSVTIAVLDSGIEWDAEDLLSKHYLHAAELPLPQRADGSPADSPDLNGDGVFDIDDWAEDPRLDPAAGQDRADGVLDPSDLIATFSDGVDDDGNGFVDDISGWDFFWNDNDPYDDTRYGHGTGEAKDSAAEGNDGRGDIGVCPNCRVMSLRVGDSFVADIQSFTGAVRYAVSMDAKVIQEALGTLNHSADAQDAIDHAWDNGVLVVASAADETSYHPNQPGANPHTLYVHAVRHDADAREDSETFLAYSNCTNHGVRLDLSAPSTSCSSGAVGVTSGVAGLVYSAAQEAGIKLSAAEAWALIALTADDIDQSWATDIFSAAEPRWYPTKAGWDRYSGYGRINAARAVEAALSGQIPPEADLRAPGFFRVIDPTRTPTLRVEGRAAAPRSSVARWSLEAAPKEEPDAADWVEVASGSGAVDGLVAEVELAPFAAMASAAYRTYTLADEQVARETEVHKKILSLRLQVTDADGRRSEARNAVFLHADPDRTAGFGGLLDGASLEPSPLLVDLDRDGVLDVVQATASGNIFALRGDGSPVPGWPVQTELLEEFDPAQPGNHLANPSFAAARPARASVLGSPAAGDIDGDGAPEVIVGSLRGQLWAFHGDGSVLDGFPVAQDPVDRAGLGEQLRLDEGFFSSPALGDLDQDGALDIVIGGMDGQVYAWRGDGSRIEGFPVLLQHPDSAADGVRQRTVSSPAIGDLSGDGVPDIVIGSNEPVRGTYAPLWAISGRGNDDPGGAVLPGWPVLLFGSGADVLPMVGEGTPQSPLLADIDGDGALEVACHGTAGPLVVLRADGSQVYQAINTLDGYGPGSNVYDSASFPFINSPSAGDLNGDGQIDLVTGAIGSGYLVNALNDGQRTRFDFPIIAWDGATGRPLPAWPRQLEDMQFFMNPAIADVDGDGQVEIIHGSGGFLLHALSADGTEPAGWPKLTGQWILGSPTVGDIDGDDLLEVVVGTRQGELFAWDTPAPTWARVDWAGFGHDPAHTLNAETALVGWNAEPPVSDTADSGGAPFDSKTQPGGCGCAGAPRGAGGGAGLLALGLGALLLRRRRA